MSAKTVARSEACSGTLSRTESPQARQARYDLYAKAVPMQYGTIRLDTSTDSCGALSFSRLTLGHTKPEVHPTVTAKIHQ
jgi:hypothetical protein